MASGGIQQFVLHLGKELRGLALTGLVVTAEGEQVANLLIEALFRSANITNAFQQLIEVIPAAGVLEALIVHHEALEQELLEMGAGPLTKLHATRRTHAIADG